MVRPPLMDTPVVTLTQVKAAEHVRSRMNLEIPSDGGV